MWTMDIVVIAVVGLKLKQPILTAAPIIIIIIIIIIILIKPKITIAVISSGG